MKVCSFVFCLVFGDLIKLGLENSLFIEIIVFTLMYLYLIYGSKLLWYRVEHLCDLPLTFFFISRTPFRML